MYAQASKLYFGMSSLFYYVGPEDQTQILRLSNILQIHINSKGPIMILHIILAIFILSKEINRNKELFSIINKKLFIIS